MQQFGAWDRSYFASLGLLSPSGCADAGRVYFHADTDQRTRETANALAEGMLPGCALPSTRSTAMDPIPCLTRWRQASGMPPAKSLALR